MFVKAIVFVSIFTMGVFAVEDGLSIMDSGEFSKKVTPEKMTASMNLSAKFKSFAEAKQFAENVKKRLKPQGDICKVESSSIRPNIKYSSNGNQSVDGYLSYSDIKCEFSELTDYDKVLKEVHALKQSTKYGSLSANPISWYLTQSQIEQESKVLKTEAIEYAQKRAIELSKTTNLKCKVKSIRFQNGHEPIEVKAYLSRSADVQESLTPTESIEPKEQKVSIRADYEWVCR